MMMQNQKERQSLSIHQKIRKASFVHVEPEQTTRFKYLENFFRSKKFGERLASIKRKFNTGVQKVDLWMKKVDWAKTRNDLSAFFVEAFIEGLSANFVTHYLFGVKFSFAMIMAHGIFIKHGLGLYWRLRIQNGSNPTIPKKD